MKRIQILLFTVTAIVMGLLSTRVFASDFNIPFVNAAGLGDMYADWATSAQDASTSFTNPAGLTELKHPQLVGVADGIMGSTRFNGYGSPGFPPQQYGSASSKLRALLPSFYVSKPMSDRVVIGFGATIPFGLGTNYSKQSVVRYAATRSQIAVVDIGPSIGFKVNDKVSLGVGLDFQHMAFTLNNMTFLAPGIDGESQNHLRGWGYGLHAGILYQPFPSTRIGFDYNTQTVFHTTGDSEFFSPGNEFRTTSQKANVFLPALAQISIQQALNQKWTVMGTIFYSRWSVFKQLTLKNTMIPTGTPISVSIPFNYHDTFDYSIGASYKATDKWLLRAGAEFLGSPTNNRNRSVGDPLGKAIIIGIGAHYQQNKCLGYDFGYAHGFFNQSLFNNITPVSTTAGHSTSNTNIFGAQINWNFA